MVVEARTDFKRVQVSYVTNAQSKSAVHVVPSEPPKSSVNTLLTRKGNPADNTISQCLYELITTSTSWKCCLQSSVI
jgi:hypothetical protein